jgi:hypothetical protein
LCALPAQQTTAKNGGFIDCGETAFEFGSMRSDEVSKSTAVQQTDNKLLLQACTNLYCVRSRFVSIGIPTKTSTNSLALEQQHQQQ